MSQFGTQISSDDIIETLSFFDDWEDRYKYIIDLGRELPPLDAAQRTDEHLVRGCQSQVWLVSQQRDDLLFFDADSDAFIVKGLLAVVLAAYNGKRPADIRDFDIEQYFEQLNLIKHLSVTRGNGLRAMVQRIQATAVAAL
ncbi:SufE family protein [Pseudomonas sp.]|uniref:SufE family protein n=1 Tax=Pseudomonas sp. TaxID=306 RepID=UPI0027310114|nr:SufE family protein [Pseudomonas sp.]MDP2244629.1 SufE family protein [Pseudomonas sp.]